MRRRGFLAAGFAGFLAGCDRIAQSARGGDLLRAAEGWHKTAQRALNPPGALAPEFTRADISPFFRGNGTINPTNGDYQAHLAAGFADWRLRVTGLVERPLELSLAELRALPQRTQITRHDCVEGWSAIGEWTGPQLAALLDAAGVLPAARFAVFRCADELDGAMYYESVDLVDARHPQTIVAHSLNGAPLPVRNGAPLRMRIERQLGYKHAKYLTGIEMVSSLDGIGGGRGGHWEDRGYQWYAGI
ncbi:MAG: molybdopterin-dependent oxidoreductase [Altererythrobacter sp.]|nr:molybdopterin-dependent oxidoreductase [Altererythrobacter sp.]